MTSDTLVDNLDLLDNKGKLDKYSYNHSTSAHRDFLGSRL